MKPVFLFLLIVTGSLIDSIAKTIHPKDNSMFSLFRKTDPIDTFWNWFSNNEKRLRKFEENPDKYLNEILTEARKVQRGLAIEFEPPKNGIINVTISADGDRNLFDMVKSIVAKAPVIEGWRFIAFRQRMDPEQIKTMRLKAQDHELDPAKMKFFPVVNGYTLDIIIYLNGVTEQNFNQVAYGGLLLLDNILGEYDCVMKVRNYDFQNMPTKKEELDTLLPLLDLASYVDKFHSSGK